MVLRNMFNSGLSEIKHTNKKVRGNGVRKATTEVMNKAFEFLSLRKYGNTEKLQQAGPSSTKFVWNYGWEKNFTDEEVKNHNKLMKQLDLPNLVLEQGVSISKFSSTSF